MIKKKFQMPVAVHLLLIREGKILLLRRFNTGYEDGNYSVVAGHLDGDEDVKSAMIREAMEEAGIEIKANNLQIVGVMHRKSEVERIDFFLVADSWNNEIVNMEPEKCDDLSWFEIDNLPFNTIPYIKKAIENYISGIQFDIYGW
ncbi:NUDIX domain-containing protein [Clostridium sp. MSJ-4]|uniref:NUDIX domain-containing protein n=1 Tax=Clostridium simiarum TaxID=2841506 RepID=A0ABS6EVG5_9CLOT|nr:NUDIX domain-containing protein [Clostridium simiarum]MBU5590221.1 NUDIX domain-containing protein [Clostridium simiarum]